MHLQGLLYVDVFLARDAPRRSFFEELGSRGWAAYTSPFVLTKHFFGSLDEAQQTFPFNHQPAEFLASHVGLAADEAAAKVIIEGDVAACAAAAGLEKYRAFSQVGLHPVSISEKP